MQMAAIRLEHLQGPLQTAIHDAYTAACVLKFAGFAWLQGIPDAPAAAVEDALAAAAALAKQLTEDGTPAYIKVTPYTAHHASCVNLQHCQHTCSSMKSACSSVGSSQATAHGSCSTLSRAEKDDSCYTHAAFALCAVCIFSNPRMNLCC
jgi:hypothetical protein